MNTIPAEEGAALKENSGKQAGIKCVQQETVFSHSDKSMLRVYICVCGCVLLTHSPSHAPCAFRLSVVLTDVHLFQEMYTWVSCIHPDHSPTVLEDSDAVREALQRSL